MTGVASQRSINDAVALAFPDKIPALERGTSFDSGHWVGSIRLATSTPCTLTINDPVTISPHGKLTCPLQGIIAHLGPVHFSANIDWIGVRLTGSSIGKGEHNGSVEGHAYFSSPLCGPTDGMFVPSSNITRRSLTKLEVLKHRRELAGIYVINASERLAKLREQREERANTTQGTGTCTPTLLSSCLEVGVPTFNNALGIDTVKISSSSDDLSSISSCTQITRLEELRERRRLRSASMASVTSVSESNLKPRPLSPTRIPQTPSTEHAYTPRKNNNNNNNNNNNPPTIKHTPMRSITPRRIRYEKLRRKCRKEEQVRSKLQQRLIEARHETKVMKSELNRYKAMARTVAGTVENLQGFLQQSSTETNPQSAQMLASSPNSTEEPITITVSSNNQLNSQPETQTRNHKRVATGRVTVAVEFQQSNQNDQDLAPLEK